MGTRITEKDLIKLAASSNKFKRVLMGLTKRASDSEFDETPPAMNTEQLEGQKQQMASAEQSSAKPAPKAPIQPEPQAEEQYAMEPQQEEMTPESYGIMAAREFIGPEIIEAAMAGNPHAMEVLSRTAANVARSMAEMYANQSMQGQEMPMQGEEGMGMEGEEGMGMEGEDGMPMEGEEVDPNDPNAQQQQNTPEDDLADEIVPKPEENGKDPNAKPEQSNEKTPPESTGKGFPGKPKEDGAPKEDVEKVDASDVKKLIELARSGKI